MKFQTSDKTSFGVKPKIKKGYYPGKLLKVELFANQDGSPKIGKYGKQLIFQFAVYKADPETDEPIESMKYCTDEKLKIKADVVISKFVYHMYKKSEKGKQWVEGEFQTAITPNSAITKLLKALGWEFSTDDVEVDNFIGNWVELDIDDYEQGEGDEAYTASSIKDVNPYVGPEVKKDIKEAKPVEKKKVEKQVKHEAVTEKSTEEVKNLESKIEELKKLNKDGYLTDDGLKQATEQIETEIEELKKK